ncbi:hypothetical protein [Gordonia sihwensis]|uniref:hypothetical protein n=1 Tax=Gordonia sihwensis TaxID=173559 RepID=UPI003D95A54A
MPLITDNEWSDYGDRREPGRVRRFLDSRKPSPKKATKSSVKKTKSSTRRTSRPSSAAKGKKGQQRKNTNTPSSRRLPLIAGALLLVVIAGFALMQGLRSTDEPGTAADQEVAAPVTSSKVAPSGAAEPVSDCPSQTDGLTVRGRDAGDQSSGPGVIKAFQYAYYVLRDGVAARALVVPESRMGDGAYIQSNGIDKLPRETKHCLTITDEGGGVYLVDLVETVPGGTPVPYRQRVHTKEESGKFMITSIDSLDPA